MPVHALAGDVGDDNDDAKDKVNGSSGCRRR